MATAEPRGSYDNTIADQIQRLQDAKADLKTAIESKGVPVDSSLTLGNYAQKVNLIEQGSSEPIGIDSEPFVITFTFDDVDHPASGTIDHTIEELFEAIKYNRQILIKTNDESKIYYVCGINRYSATSIDHHRSHGIIWSTSDFPFLYYGYFPLTNGQIDFSDLYTYGTSFPFYHVPTKSSSYYNISWTSLTFYMPQPCFVKGTKITMSNGKKKAVEDITYKDNLLVWDFDLKEKSQAEPLWITKKLVANNYKLVTLDDGKQMKLVGAGEDCHRLFCIEDGEFVHANNMVGKTTIYEDGTQHKVVSCEVIKEDVEYYNIITYHHMNLYAEDVLTSCRYSNLYPIEDMRYVKDGRTIRPQSEYNVEDKYYYGLRLGESQIDLDETLKYINNLRHFDYNNYNEEI